MNFKNVLYYNTKKDGTREVRIYAYLNGQKKYFPTDVRVQPTHWNEKTGYIKRSHPLHKTYNAKIRAERNKVEAHLLEGGSLTDYGKNPKGIDLLDFLDLYLKECHRGQHGYTQSTIQTYKGLRKRLREYQSHKAIRSLPFEKVDLSFYSDFCSFLVDHCNCSKPGIGKHIKKLKRVMQVAMDRQLHKNRLFRSKEFKAPTGKTNKVYLNETEIQRMAALQLKDEWLKRERDRFLLAYYLLMRYSDVCKIKKDGVFSSNDRKFYQYTSQKTKVQTVVPLSPAALRIMTTYDYDFDFTANQVANRNIKKVAALAEISQKMEEGRAKHKLITFHTARRSAATNLRLQGASLKTIADLGGWKDVKTLIVYLRASGLDSARLASELEFFK